MDLALAILTFVPDKKDRVLRRLPHLLASLEETAFSGSVVIVDDCSPHPKQREYLKSLNGQYRVIRRRERGGIARAKNTCLLALRKTNFQFGFIVEDDMEFLPGWWAAYQEAHKLSKISHFSWASDTYWSKGKMQKRPVKIERAVVVKATTLNGSFLTVTPQMIERMGGFVVGPHPWGREHINYTLRAINAGFTPFFADVQRSNEVLKLGPYSKNSFIDHAEKQVGNAINRHAATNLSLRRSLREY